MTTAGIIAEYNPFHNGHKYQLEKVRKMCDCVIVIMSGSFVQRGGIAITDKWQRAKTAIKNGADLVIELPAVYAMNTAQKFAYGAVSILNSCNAVDYLFFGSECESTDTLISAAQILENEPYEISEKIKLYVSEGMSFPAARQKAFEGIIDTKLLSKPNNILALEYIRALIRLKSNISPVAIPRSGADHDSMVSCGNIASASNIREMIFNNSDYSSFVPSDYSNIPYNSRKIENAIIYKLRSMTPHELSSINEVSEGLENRIIDAARKYSSLEDIYNAVKTKRYTGSRINRIFLSALLGLTKDLSEITPDYIRVLALNSQGGKLLREIKNSGLDIITKTADYSMKNALFEKDILSTDIAALCSPCSSMRCGGLDYINPPFILRQD